MARGDEWSATSAAKALESPVPDLVLERIDDFVDRSEQRVIPTLGDNIRSRSDEVNRGAEAGAFVGMFETDDRLIDFQCGLEGDNQVLDESLQAASGTNVLILQGEFHKKNVFQLSIPSCWERHKTSAASYFD